VVLWWLAGERDRVGARAKRALAGGEDQVVVSAVVVWEVAIKRRLGQLEAPDDLLEQLAHAGVELLPITARHADRVGTLPLHHRDPFDRLLIAQADTEGFALVSADGEFRRYGLEVVW
jgi:PIN domain nuclease of toxin-antitoxin system